MVSEANIYSVSEHAIDTAGLVLPLRAFRFVFFKFSSGAYSSACSKYNCLDELLFLVSGITSPHLVEPTHSGEKNAVIEFEHIVPHRMQKGRVLRLSIILRR